MGDDRGDIHWGRTGAYDPRSLAPWVTLLLLVALAAGAVLLAPKARAAPDFHLESTGVEGGRWHGPVAFTLSQYQGRVVVLDLMAVSCTPCRAVTEAILQPLWAQHGGRGDFAILSVDAWSDPGMPSWAPGLETRAALADLQNRTGAHWRHALDTDGVWRKYGVEALPHVLVLDRHGRIVLEERGDVDGAAVRDAVGRLLR